MTKKKIVKTKVATIPYVEPMVFTWTETHNKLNRLRSTFMTLFIVMTLACASFIAIAQGKIDDKSVMIASLMQSSHEAAETTKKLSDEVAKYKKMSCYE